MYVHVHTYTQQCMCTIEQVLVNSVYFITLRSFFTNLTMSCFCDSFHVKHMTSCKMYPYEMEQKMKIYCTCSSFIFRKPICTWTSDYNNSPGSHIKAMVSPSSSITFNMSSVLQMYSPWKIIYTIYTLIYGKDSTDIIIINTLYYYTM